jgi:hypothetical protein
MNTLQHAYAARHQEYEQLTRVINPANIPKIRQLILEMSGILSTILTEMGDSPLMDDYRSDLIRKLVKLQNTFTKMTPQSQ